MSGDDVKPFTIGGNSTDLENPRSNDTQKFIESELKKREEDFESILNDKVEVLKAKLIPHWLKPWNTTSSIIAEMKLKLNADVYLAAPSDVKDRLLISEIAREADVPKMHAIPKNYTPKKLFEMCDTGLKLLDSKNLELVGCSGTADNIKQCQEVVAHILQSLENHQCSKTPKASHSETDTVLPNEVMLQQEKSCNQAVEILIHIDLLLLKTLPDRELYCQFEPISATLRGGDLRTVYLEHLFTVYSHKKLDFGHLKERRLVL